jgi:F-type H+-transporting ATPase subunit gamma
MIPHILEYSLYKLILEAVTSEQIYRRIAMKSASDAANDMTKSLTRLYNRKRQGKITQEISEIVAGADAIK